ncbi:MAG: alpha-glucuronidase family glycosyl hydrolase, partial [Lentisphaeria bacterium]
MKMKMMFTALLIATALLGKEFQIAQAGKTDYNIVIIGEKNEINDFAGEELSYFLRKSTGAEFKISATATAKNFFIGTQETAPTSLQDQAYVIETKGENIYLYGKGKHGNLYAVYEYLERIIGIRWFSAYGDTKIPALPELKHQDLHIAGNYSFRIRSTQT